MPCDPSANPPVHHWEWHGYHRTTCECGSTAAQLIRTDQGWRISLDDGMELLSKTIPARVDLPEPIGDVSLTCPVNTD